MHNLGATQRPALPALGARFVRCRLIAAHSHDGKIVAVGRADKTIIVWDSKTGNKIATLVGHTEMVDSVAFSPDGVQLVSGRM